LFASRWNRRLPFELVLQAVSSGTVVGLGSVLTRMLGLCFEKAIAGNGVPETVTIDKSGANFAGLNAINADREVPIKIRQSKYLNNVVEVRHEVAYRSCSHFSRYRRSEPPVSPGESRSLNQERL
jgi:hypothetical protein